MEIIVTEKEIDDYIEHLSKTNILTNRVEAECFIHNFKTMEAQYLGAIPIPEDTRTEEQKDLDNFKWAIDENNKVVLA